MKHKTQGFTLIEVVIAFAILGLSVGAILNLCSTGYARVLKTTNTRLAVLAARSLVDAIRTEQGFVSGHQSGTMAPDIRWKIDIRPFDDAASEVSEASSTTLTPYFIAVHAEKGIGPNKGEADIQTIQLKFGAL